MYTFKFNFSYHFIFAIIIILLFAIFSFILAYCHLKTRKRTLISIIIMFFVFLIFSYLLIIHDVIGYYKIKKEIRENRVCYVEGYVEDFSTPSNPSFWTHEGEKFNLEGVHFRYYLELYGYTRMKNAGGIIRENVYLKIGYVEYEGRNVIVFVEILN